MMSRPMFKKAYKTNVKSTFSISGVVLCALAWCHASVFAAQGPSENNLGISSTWPWTQVVTKFSQDIPRWTQVASNSSQYSPKMNPSCPKMTPERIQVALKSSQDSFKVKASKSKVQGPGSRGGSAGPRRVCIFFRRAFRLKGVWSNQIRSQG